MKILGMGMPELLIILCVVLLIFGPKNLPKLGASLGKTVKGLREGMAGDDNKVEVAQDEPEEQVVERLSEAEPEAPATKKVRATRKTEQTA